MKMKRKQTLVIDVENTLVTKIDFNCSNLTSLIIEADRSGSMSFIIINPPKGIKYCKKKVCNCGTQVFKVSPYTENFLATIMPQYELIAYSKLSSQTLFTIVTRLN